MGMGGALLSDYPAIQWFMVGGFTETRLTNESWWVGVGSIRGPIHRSMGSSRHATTLLV